MHADELSALDMSDSVKKSKAYQELLLQTRGLLSEERDWLANAAQFAALIGQQLPDINWAGFYLNKNNELVLGPFQGKVACVRIPFERGVCGACARTGKVQLVADVHAFPGHIACDAASNAELVVPILVDGALWGVFDIDSPSHGRFDSIDAAGVEACIQVFIGSTQFS